MRPQVFISRTISEERRKVYEEKYAITLLSLSLIEFEALPKVVLPDYQMVFFYSRMAVKYFLKIYGAKSLVSKRIGTLGPAAQDELAKSNILTDFCGNGDPESSRMPLADYAQSMNVLFPRARISKRSLQLVDSGYQSIDLILYNNSSKQNIRIPEADVYLFTSPLNVKSYLSNHGKKNILAIAIGKTTERELLSSGFKKVHKSETSSESHIIEKAVTILNQTNH